MQIRSVPSPPDLKTERLTSGPLPPPLFRQKSAFLGKMEASAEGAFTYTFQEQKLGFRLVLAIVNAEARAVVDKVLETCPCTALEERDVLLEVNGERVDAKTAASFEVLVAHIAELERPLELTFAHSKRPRTDAVALKEYERRTEVDLDGKAAYNASILRARGLGCDNQDLAAALLLLRKSAALGVARAQLQLARLYATGKGGVRRDDDEAFRWYDMAAKQDDPDALYHLGCFYEEGRGTLKDESEALWCFFRASKAGHEKSKLAAQAIVSKRRNTSSWDIFSAFRSYSKKPAPTDPVNNPVNTEGLLPEEDRPTLGIAPQYSDSFYEPPTLDDPPPRPSYQQSNPFIDDEDDEASLIHL